jgi:hypothetical protein
VNIGVISALLQGRCEVGSGLVNGELQLFSLGKASARYIYYPECPTAAEFGARA